MIGELTLHQLKALAHLTAYRAKFYDDRPSLFPKNKNSDPVQQFIDIFCENNFADTDYSMIQREPLEFDTPEDWAEQASLPAILKCFTYFIWTDKIVTGYFQSRIESRMVDKLLLRLETLLKEENVLA